jgi:O-antigen/teichoic acid export membrane protein
MTTKVVKGSLWTLLSQIVPLVATLVSTPITIRLLGNEGYGVLILIGLIPMYISFADLGMSVASTRFGSAAYGSGDREGESSVVWTAAAIAFCSTVFIVAPIFMFAGDVVRAMNVPAELAYEGMVALRFALVAFVVGVLGNIFNTPQLARLRMDFNALIGGGSRVLLSIATPIALLLGGGLIGATIVGLLITVLTLLAHFIVSARLLSELRRPTISRVVILPIIKFGLGLFISGIAVALIVNLEKIMLPRLVSVEALAFYSVAFTFANMTSMFGISMVQTLVPAFSQLTTSDRSQEFNALFARGVRLNLMWVPMAVMFLFVIAGPFFEVWAGEDFGRYSTVPFYILLGGLLFNLVAYVPYSAVTAFGRSDVLAKLYWAELLLFTGITFLLISRFGIIGAALSWSLRVIADAIAVIWLCKRFAMVTFPFTRHFLWLFVGMLTLLPPFYLAIFHRQDVIALLISVLVCSTVYLSGTWKYLVKPDEKVWLKGHLGNLLSSNRAS